MPAHTGNDLDPGPSPLPQHMGSHPPSIWRGRWAQLSSCHITGLLQPMEAQTLRLSLVSPMVAPFGGFLSGFFSLGCCYYSVQYLIFP